MSKKQTPNVSDFARRVQAAANLAPGIEQRNISNRSILPRGELDISMLFELRDMVNEALASDPAVPYTIFRHKAEEIISRYPSFSRPQAQASDSWDQLWKRTSAPL